MSKENRSEISRAAAIELLKRLVGKNPSLSTPIKQVFALNGRATKTSRQNSGWLYTNMSKLKFHGLASSVTRFENGSKRVVAIKLTHSGQEALGTQYQTSSGKELPKASKESVQTAISIDELSRLIEQWRVNNPGFKRIEFANWEVIFKEQQK